MSLGNQDVDKLVQAIKDGVIVYADYKEKKENDGKVDLTEAGVLAITHAGKALRFVSNLQEIGNELIDIEAKEGADISKALTDSFTTGNPYVVEGVNNTIKGIVFLKDGLETLSKALKWEKEQKEEATA